MDKDFWDKAFGGKDTLRLSINARNFHIRQNRYSSTATFEYGEGMRVRIVYGTHGRSNKVPRYAIYGGAGLGLWTGRHWCTSINSLSYSVQNLTGLVLNCFE